MSFRRILRPYDVDLVPMLPLISAALIILSALVLKRLLAVVRKQRQQARFIRETLADGMLAQSNASISAGRF